MEEDRMTNVEGNPNDQMSNRGAREKYRKSKFSAQSKHRVYAIRLLRANLSVRIPALGCVRFFGGSAIVHRATPGRVAPPSRQGGGVAKRQEASPYAINRIGTRTGATGH